MRTTFATLAASTILSQATDTAPADTGSTAAPESPKADAKPKTTLEGMTGYRTFDSTEDAMAYLQKCGEDFSDFGEQPFAMVGIDDAGNFDPEIYTPEMRVRVAVLRNVPRTTTVNGKPVRDPTTIKAIVVTPVPTLESLMADEAGQSWLLKVLDKELNHVAVRPLRDAENLETAMSQMPTTRAGFIESTRDGGGIMDTFNDLHQIINDQLKKSVPIWNKAKLIKAELKKAMESKAYATEYYPALEDRGDKPSLFVLALQFGQKVAKNKGLAPDIFDKWLATRDAQTLKGATAEDDNDVSLDDLTADLFGSDDSTEKTDNTAAA